MDWDIFAISPIIILFLFIMYGLMLKTKESNVRSKLQKMFLCQTFLFWLGIFLVVNNNYELGYALKKYHLTDLKGAGVIFLTSTLFYSVLAMIPYNLGVRFLQWKGVKIYEISSYATSLLGILVLMINPQSLVISIIALALLGYSFSIVSYYYLAYNELFCNKFYVFRTVGLIAPLMALAAMVGLNLSHIFDRLLLESGKISYHSFIIIIGMLAIVSISASLILYILLPHGDVSLLPYTLKQKEILEPYRVGRIIIIFSMFCVVILLYEITHTNLATWWLSQHVYDYISKDFNTIALYQRLENLITMLGQFAGIMIACRWLYNKIGAKYSFAIGLVIWIIFFVISAFNSSANAALFLGLLNGLGFGICFSILYAIAIEWNNRGPKNYSTIGQIQLLLFLVQFLVGLIDNIVLQQHKGVYNNISDIDSFIDNYVVINQTISPILENVIVIIYSSCASILIGIFVLFYYTSDYILAEYRHHLVLMVPKIDLMLRESFANKIRPDITLEFD